MIKATDKELITENSTCGITLSQIDDTRYQILTEKKLTPVLGAVRAKLLVARVRAQYPTQDQPLQQRLYPGKFKKFIEGIEMIQGRSGRHPVLAIPKSHLAAFLKAEGFKWVPRNPKQVNLFKYTVLTRSGLTEILGYSRAIEFIRHFVSQYSIDDMELETLVHNQFTLKKFKNGSIDVLTIEKDQFLAFYTAEGFQYETPKETFNPDTQTLLGYHQVYPLFSKQKDWRAKAFVDYLHQRYPIKNTPDSLMVHTNIELKIVLYGQNKKKVHVIPNGRLEDFLNSEMEQFLQFFEVWANKKKQSKKPQLNRS